MKNTTKRLLAGVLASSLALSMTALATNTTKVSGEPVPLDFAEVQSTETLSTMQVRSAYFDFYQTYGVEKAAEVFYNGTALAFEDAFPLIEEGTTFVPLAVFADAIGAKTDYIAETHSVSLEYKGDLITFDINDTAFYVNGGEAQELPFATFVASERTMVPVRFITDAFGLGLYWNGDYKQVVAVDMAELKAGISSNYSKINSVFAMSNYQEVGQSMNMSGTGYQTLEMNGKSATMNADFTGVMEDDLSSMECALSVSADFSAFESDIVAMLNSMSAEDSTEVAQQLLGSLNDFDVNVVYDVDSLSAYVQSGLVADLIPVMFGADASALGVSAGTWYQLELSDMMLDSQVVGLQSMMGQYTTEVVSTMDELVDSVMELTRYYDNSTMNFYGGLEQILASLHDDKFVVSGSDEATGNTIYTVNDSFNDGTKTVNYGLTIQMDENNELTLCVVTGDFTEGNETVSFESEQTANTVTFETESTVSGMKTTVGGSIDLRYTDDAVTIPSSNIYDLTNIF